MQAPVGLSDDALYTRLRLLFVPPKVSHCALHLRPGAAASPNQALALLRLRDSGLGRASTHTGALRRAATGFSARRQVIWVCGPPASGKGAISAALAAALSGAHELSS